MKINFNQKVRSNNLSFKAIKKVKFKRDFNPNVNKEDYRAFQSVFVSDAFKYLFKERDVILEFDKFYRKSDNRINTVLHYEFSPLKEKGLSLREKIIYRLFNLLS